MKNLFKHLKTTISGVLVALLLLSCIPTTDYNLPQDTIDEIEDVSPCYDDNNLQNS